MEFVTGYRAEVLDLAELLLAWHRSQAGGPRDRQHQRRQEGHVRRLPPDPALWLLHLLPNPRLGLALPGEVQGEPRGRLCGEDALQLRDLQRAVTFLRLDEEDEGPETGQALVHVERLLLVTDEHGTVMGLDFQLGAGGPPKPSTPPPLEQLALGLLCESMACPMGGGEPRRPRLLAVGDPTLHKSLEPLLPQLGVRLSPDPMRGWGPKPTFTLPSMRVRACHVCKRHGFQGRLVPCQQCRAVLYCSERCRAADWARSPEDAAHRAWCPRMAGYMARARQLADLPFTFAAEVTSDGFNREGFLAARGLTWGYWAHESMLVRAPDYGVGLGGQKDWRPGLLQSGSWREYYAWRGLPLGSPLAALLSYPLSVYYIVTQLVPRHFPELNILNKQSLRIHIVETGKESDMAPLFWELSVLLPHVSLELLFVGGVLPPEADGQQVLLQRTEAQGVRIWPGPAPKAKGGRGGLQLKFCAQPTPLLPGPKPDLVIGFNSGFALKDTWLSALPRLQALRVPAYFTECSEYSCAVDEATVSMATGGSAGPAHVNPFRSPFRQAGIDNAMPWYSNAFIFHLLYKGGAGGVRQLPGLVPPPAPSPTGQEPGPGRPRRKEKRQNRSGRRRK
ncbi:transmembrane 4 L6 family member 5 isoform X8 [Malaclemys terrapin pileata]|uniref:transmembrane 4 L6 family member 5 isoform X8 n=1 Tax=Malaclemys terrapin pileata TaxID=2991368 RepID=UPI0023A8671B|nr:transmembrane 4 L6 family member 5 isoform X8 [Malaclemys terrapin pileata]